MSPAEALAAELGDAAARGFLAWNQALIELLAERVEFRHEPPAEGLDGARSRERAAEYLEAEVEAFPRAFEDLALEVELEAEGADTVAGAVWYRGTLGPPERRPVTIGFRAVFGLEDGRISRFGGSPLPETEREDLIAWLRAVEGAGGFHPPAADLPPPP